MSLVAYDSSDDNSEDEEVNSTECIVGKNEITSLTKCIDEDLCLPQDELSKVNWNALPKPKNSSSEETNFTEEGEIPLKKEVEQDKKPTRKAVKILVPSLSEFNDLNEEDKKKQNKIEPSEKESKLFSLLPPPKTVEQKNTKSLIPNVVVKAQNILVAKKLPPGDKPDTSNYDPNSEDEGESETNKNDTHESGMDFFALNTVTSFVDTGSAIPDSRDPKINENVNINSIADDNNTEFSEEYPQNSNKTLISNVINLPREEILIKNKAEVGPKLPVPEQEYNVDAEGNVAFDEKAIEYLCGRRGIKRKNKEMDEANIIEISGDDIKPDEREWLMKALTEEPVQRPVSLQSSGINSQSKKKHQITYLAHQAKAMELELKNQWALNRMTRKQTQSKYGF